MTLIFSGLTALLGIDPAIYSPTGQGVSGDSSKAGAVEKTIAAMAKDPLLFALSLPSVVLGAPLTEEVLFRGALFSGLVASPLGRTGAVLITAALWAFAHAAAAPWLTIGMLFLMGIFLGLLLLRFGSLWVTIACHAAWNAMSAIALFSAGTHS
ncbi:MAG: CPBP family intramembrane metalloprotease [Alphaproteobacteria bacterium]|nr:CPBP family intramembrane metalloprotease [Alphaproteobacteria bacterium]